MNLERGWLIICVVVGLVLVFNLGLAYSLFSGSAHRQIEMIGRVMRRAREPWKGEDQDLAQLHELVESLNPKEAQDEEPQ